MRVFSVFYVELITYNNEKEIWKIIWNRRRRKNLTVSNWALTKNRDICAIEFKGKDFYVPSRDLTGTLFIL